VSSTGGNLDVVGKATGGRKLIAVVYADMVGYSRLIGLDDAGTLSRLRTLRSKLIDPAIHEYGGRVVQTGGDSLLVAFDSIDGAVRCAVHVQQQVPAYDGNQPPDRRIRFRVGINIGDVIPEGTNLHGDGVNIAARLEAACPVGGICVSRSVRDHVHGRLDLVFEPIGELALKNIARPVEAFVLRLGPVARERAKDAAPAAQRAHSSYNLLLAGLAGLLLVAVGGVGWWLYRGAGTPPHTTQALPTSLSPTTQPYTPQNIGLSNAPRLSIIVLPFENLSGNPAEDYLADGITDDLISDLQQIPDALVIARNTTYSYSRKLRDVRQIGQELGVRYAVEGSTRRMGDILRVNVQLTSTETGAQLWSDRFDQQINNLAAGQEEIVTRMRTALGINLYEIEKARSLRERPTNPDAFDLILQARALYNQPPDPQRQQHACELFERALALDSSSVSAITWVVLCLIGQADSSGGWDASRDNLDAKQRTERLVAQANAIAPESRLTLGATFQWLRSQGRCREAIPVADKLVERFPNFALGYAYLGSCKLLTGNADEDISLEKKAIRLNPRDPNMFLRYWRLGTASLRLNKDQDAIEYLSKALALEGNFGGSKAAIHRDLAVAYARSGRMEQAKHALAEADRLFRYDTVRSHSPDDPSSTALADQIRAYQTGLRLAGERDHAEEDADFGVPSDTLLHPKLIGRTPKDAQGVMTIRTADLVQLLANARPILIDTMTNTWGSSIPGAIGLRFAGVGGSFADAAQDHLRGKMQELTAGDFNRPIVAVGWNSERFDGRNLALRLVALGYTNVYWYRGGREAWEVAGLPETDLDVQDW
jgi:TolB-like protein/class 3 adenylate cyclase/rhodanese-related sulfurtransferase